LAITGAMNLAQQTASFMSGQVIEALAKSNPKMPQRAVDLVREEVSAVLAENMPGLQEMIVSSYSAHFTRSEINDVVTFYETETGKKVIRVMPAVLQELMVTGKRWGQSLTPIAEKRISERLQREGFIPRK